MQIAVFVYTHSFSRESTQSFMHILCSSSGFGKCMLTLWMFISISLVQLGHTWEEKIKFKKCFFSPNKIIMWCLMMVVIFWSICLCYVSQPIYSPLCTSCFRPGLQLLIIVCTDSSANYFSSSHNNLFILANLHIITQKIFNVLSHMTQKTKSKSSHLRTSKYFSYRNNLDN